MNPWFSPIVSRLASMDNMMNAFMRTTTAITIVDAGFKNNVIPTTARAIIDHRIHPGFGIYKEPYNILFGPYDVDHTMWTIRYGPYNLPNNFTFSRNKIFDKIVVGRLVVHRSLVRSFSPRCTGSFEKSYK